VAPKSSRLSNSMRRYGTCRSSRIVSAAYWHSTSSDSRPQKLPTSPVIPYSPCGVSFDAPGSRCAKVSPRVPTGLAKLVRPGRDEWRSLQLAAHAYHPVLRGGTETS